jgi:hypothetical protein
MDTCIWANLLKGRVYAANRLFKPLSRLLKFLFLLFADGLKLKILLCPIFQCFAIKFNSINANVPELQIH